MLAKYCKNTHLLSLTPEKWPKTYPQAVWITDMTAFFHVVPSDGRGNSLLFGPGSLFFPDNLVNYVTRNHLIMREFHGR
jgi:hypothetical protein